MKSNAQLRALVPIVIGLLGMGAYQIIVHLDHPMVMENDFFHGIWFGVCVGLEITGLHLLFKNKSSSSA